VCAAVTFGGDVSLTSDFIYRGLSESNGHPALQLDLHASDVSGNFIGVWGSTRDRGVEPRADADVDVYVGHRFNFVGTWSTSLSAHYYAYVAGQQDRSSDYQELSASVSYLDRWTLSLSAIPNAIRYLPYYRVERSPAYVAETTVQWLLGNHLLVMGGAGYYSIDGAAEYGSSAGGYAYGNAGLGVIWRRYRLELGYFVTQNRAQSLLPYPLANDRVAATLSFSF
jgi:uncharacterized protein (TIGR02001 family)